ncbi:MULTISPECIES: DMT family transporter [unclassified Roseobacter]|uniref:DMT family transporter n=1 Tax=unclassified Roseobacter TaxID=196798 RepID=UPI0018A318E9|nr:MULTISPECIES: DMT family transporter [unclassified Roseobacter]MDW3181384.1 DMT family transporter [Roseobacter sp.]
MNPNLKAALMALTAFGLFASHDVIIKVLGGGYSPVQIVFFSVLFSFPLAMLYLLRDATPGTLIPVHPWWMAARTVAAVITGFCAFYAFSVLPLAQVYAILFASPLLITVLAIPILGEQVKLRRWIAVAVGLTGVLVVLRPGQAELELGHLAALVSAICGSFASIIVRKIGREERSVVIMLYPMMANFVVMAALLPLVYQPLPLADLGKLGIIAVLAWTAGRFLIAAYNNGEAVIVAPMQYSQILWATMYGLLFFDEQPDRNTIIGSAIIIASGLFIVLRESRSEASEQPVLRTRSRPETGTTPRVSPFLRRDKRGK